MFLLSLAFAAKGASVLIAIVIFRFVQLHIQRKIAARRFATIRRRETGAMLLSLSAIYFLRRRCACESNVPTVRGRRGVN